MKLKITVLFILASFIYVIFNIGHWKEKRTLFWDKSGYYAYLPATFIYDDIGRLGFLDSLNPKYRFTGDYNDYGIYEQPTGKRLNKYHVGVAVFQLPFFMMGHAYTLLEGTYPADGYSPYYMLLICLSTAFWSAMGFWVLGKFLRQYFNELPTIITLLLLAFGTNLYFYSSFDTGMSHPYSFFLFACVLQLTDEWYRKGKRSSVVLLGLVFGLLFLIRPVNIICLLIPLLWQTDQEKIGTRVQFFWKQKTGLILSIVAGLAVSLLQLSYWKFVSGHWLKYSYEGEGFHFLSPHIMDGLFSYRKGWFVYTPLALIAFIGFFFIPKKYYKVVPALLSTLLVAIYIVFSWSQWYYGGSYGCRAMIEFLSLLSFPLAALIAFVIGQRWLVKVAASVVLVLVMSLSFWQTYQFHLGVIPWDYVTKEYYWSVFFKTAYNEQDKALLMPEGR